jgi:ABC-type transporter Mla MlaB component
MGDSAVRFTVGAVVTRTDIPALCARLADQLRGQAGDLVECDVGGIREPDVAAVEAVARLRLTARRHGRRLRVTGAGPELLLLFGLLGLTELLTPDKADHRPDGDRTGGPPNSEAQIRDVRNDKTRNHEVRNDETRNDEGGDGGGVGSDKAGPGRARRGKAGTGGAGWE